MHVIIFRFVEKREREGEMVVWYGGASCRFGSYGGVITVLLAGGGFDRGALDLLVSSPFEELERSQPAKEEPANWSADTK